MRKIKVVVLLDRQLQHGFAKNAKVSPNLTVAHILYVFNVSMACTITHYRSCIQLRTCAHIDCPLYNYNACNYEIKHPFHAPMT